MNGGPYGNLSLKYDLSSTKSRLILQYHISRQFDHWVSTCNMRTDRPNAINTGLIFIHTLVLGLLNPMFFFISNAPHVLYGLRGLSSWAW